MNNLEYIAKIIIERLEADSSLVLVSIVSVEGSSPRHKGAKMVIDADRRCYGTIGGSLVEAAVISEARRVMDQGCSCLIDFDFTGNNAYSNGMICGGKAGILLEYIPATLQNTKFFKRWYEMVRSGHDNCLITMFRQNGESIDIIGHSLLSSAGEVAGDYPWSSSDMEKLLPLLKNARTITMLSLGDITALVEPVGRVKSLYCFGAGHVAVPTAHLAALVGFRVVVVDDRSEFANAERFPEADEIVVTEDFDRALEDLDIDGDSFVVIVTRDHQYDRTVLAQAIRTEAGYIGMISSRKKREAVYSALLAEGATREKLDNVHSPIGLSIGAETPEEIAVSIVGELVSVRSQQSKC